MRRSREIDASLPQDLLLSDRFLTDKPFCDKPHFLCDGSAVEASGEDNVRYLSRTELLLTGSVYFI